MNRDEQHLNSLAIAHYVVGAFSILFSLLPLIHVTIGLMMLSGRFPDDEAPEFVGWALVFMGLLFVFIGVAFSICIIVSGRRLATRRGYWFSFVVACILCAFAPIGTVLGVFTIVVLARESVKALYGVRTPGPVPPSVPAGP